MTGNKIGEILFLMKKKNFMYLSQQGSTHAASISRKLASSNVLFHDRRLCGCCFVFVFGGGSSVCILGVGGGACKCVCILVLLFYLSFALM